MYQNIQSNKELIYVINCARRLGKTFTMGVIAMETALRTPNTQVHFSAPQQNQVKEYLHPIFSQILQDCPIDLLPQWKHFDAKYIFPNGSYIKLCGCNNQQFNNLRGNKSDLFIIDEARDVDELETVVKDIALPQLLSSENPNKKIIIPSTPPTTPDHPFKIYAERAKGRGAYSCHTIHESWYKPEELEIFIEECGGVESTTWKREFLAQFVTDEKLHIIPEWKEHPEYIAEITKDDYFQFYTIVSGMDVGYRDFTAWIGGYYDFNAGKLVIEHEVALRENEFTTDVLANQINEKELEYLRVNNTRPRRIADNSNLNILADLSRLHKLSFAPVSKKNGKEWMVNQTRQFIKAGKLVVHPRCKMLIASLDFGIWKTDRIEFARSPDLGHYDFIDALVYLVAGLIPSIQNRNPIPPLYKLNVATMMFPNGRPPMSAPEEQDDVVRKMFPPIF